MKSTIHKHHSVERILADHRRTRTIYGVALVIVTITLTYIVLFTKNPYLF